MNQGDEMSSNEQSGYWQKFSDGTEEFRSWNALTDADRERAFNSLPDMLDGFLKKWGWLHFAQAIEEICREKNFNVAKPEQPVALSTLTGEPRFFIDHDCIHDRLTGRHIHGDRDIEPGLADDAVAMLNELHRLAASGPTQRAGQGDPEGLDEWIDSLTSAFNGTCNTPLNLDDARALVKAVLRRHTQLSALFIAPTTPQPVAAEKSLRAIIAHWNEFGPRHGFGELMDRIQDAEQGGKL